jgi:hypothetical protein
MAGETVTSGQDLRVAAGLAANAVIRNYRPRVAISPAR